ncbi:MAG TPA: nitrate reductase molybdenum cofactor assembly chaperone, partial [Sphingomonadales bacterium]|nr:nitrate reductase molybdenum cofactor assembly chaperone [Sphingomonadales bacterium]
MKTLKILSLLLSYPTRDLQKGAGVLKDTLYQEALLKKRTLRQLFDFIDDLAASDLMDIQSAYVHLFDRTRSLSLHLFEHVHGESRDRGQAMVDLLMLYEKNGLEIGAKELPDFLPLYLEFLSTLPGDEARDLLREPLGIIGALKARLEKRKSPYAFVFKALEEVAGKPAAKGEVKTHLESKLDDNPEDFAAIDEAWEEKEVRFGPDAPGGECP